MTDLTRLLLSSVIAFFVGILTGFLTRRPMDKLSERRSFIRNIAGTARRVRPFLRLRFSIRLQNKVI